MSTLLWVHLMSHVKAVHVLDLKLKIQLYCPDVLSGINPTVNLSITLQLIKMQITRHPYVT